MWILFYFNKACSHTSFALITFALLIWTSQQMNVEVLDVFCNLATISIWEILIPAKEEKLECSKCSGCSEQWLWCKTVTLPQLWGSLRWSTWETLKKKFNRCHHTIMSSQSSTVGSKIAGLSIVQCFTMILGLLSKTLFYFNYHCIDKCSSSIRETASRIQKSELNISYNTIPLSATTAISATVIALTHGEIHCNRVKFTCK